MPNEKKQSKDALRYGKENFGLRFTRYRGLKRVTQSLLLIFACMNFKKLARWKAMAAYEYVAFFFFKPFFICFY